MENIPGYELRLRRIFGSLSLDDMTDATVSQTITEHVHDLNVLLHFAVAHKELHVRVDGANTNVTPAGRKRIAPVTVLVSQELGRVDG